MRRQTSTARIEVRTTEWSKTGDRKTPGILLTDAAFEKKSKDLWSASGQRVKLVTTYTSAKTEDRPNFPDESKSVRTRQSLRAPMEHGVGRLNSPSGYGILRKTQRTMAYARLEMALDACMSLENIAMRSQHGWPVTPDPQADSLQFPRRRSGCLPLERTPVQHPRCGRFAL